MHVAQHSTAARRARDSAHHLLITSNSQMSGHVVSSNAKLEVTAESSLLCVSVEPGTLQRALLYACELMEATPKPVDAAGDTLANPKTPGAQGTSLPGVSMLVRRISYLLPGQSQSQQMKLHPAA